jgi:hypothetical protein
LATVGSSLDAATLTASLATGREASSDQILVEVVGLKYLL